MRIDKFLWCVRYFKTRNNATEACKTGKIKTNNTNAKPSREVFIGDKISVRKNQIDYMFEIIAYPESRIGAKLVNLYIKDTTPPENLEKLDLLKYAKDHYRKKGAGRPTKKDRRDLDDYTE